MVLGGFGRAVDVFIAFEDFSELSVGLFFGGVVLFGDDAGDFDEHGGNVVDGFDEVGVDVHVDWDESSSFFLLVEGVLGQALSDEFLQSLRGDNLGETVYGFLDESAAESADSHLHKDSVVEDLEVWLKALGVVDDVGHQNEVLGFLVSTVDGVVVDVVEDGFGDGLAVRLGVEFLGEGGDGSLDGVVSVELVFGADVSLVG